MNNTEFNKNKYRFSSKKKLRSVENSQDIEDKKMAFKYLRRELKSYCIEYSDFYNCNISYGDRNILLNIAIYIANDDKLKDETLSTRHIPIKKLIKITKISHKFFQKYDSYLMLYVLIFVNPKYDVIRRYLSIEARDESLSEKALIVAPKRNDSISGLVIKRVKNYGVVLTPMGEVCRVKNASSVEGYEVSGKPKKSFKYYLRYVAAVLVVATIIGIIGFVDYNKVEAIAVLSGTSDFKIEVNKYDKVVEMKSETQKGRITVQGIDYKYKDIDETFKVLIDKMMATNMIPNDEKVVLIVTGESLKDTDFRLIEKAISDNNKENKTNIKLIINNNGIKY